MANLLVRIASPAIAMVLALVGPGLAQEKLKIAVGQGIPFDTAFPIAAVKAGIFKKHGLDVEVLTTNGGGETLQAVISGSVDVGIAAGLTMRDAVDFKYLSAPLSAEQQKLLFQLDAVRPASK